MSTGSHPSTSSSSSSAAGSSSTAASSGGGNTVTGGPTDAQQELKEFWPNAANQIKALSNAELKTQELPLARIKKIMKLDEDVKMISAEAPVLFAKAAEIFIHELTLRAWIHTEDNKRRTLQRNDIAMAISKYDQFDFLIDIVPRDELKPAKKEETKPPPGATTVIGTDQLGNQVQYYLQLAAQQQSALQQPNVQLVQTPNGVQALQFVQSSTGPTAVVQAPQLISQSHPHQQILQIQGNQLIQQPPQQQQLQIVQQVLGSNGEIQNIPLQLNPQQLQQMLRLQLQSQANAQAQPSIILQTSPIQQQQPQQPTTHGQLTSPQNGTQLIS